jgi:YbbR domain-containing protein
MIKNKDKLIIQVFCIVAALITWLFVVNEVNPVIIKDVASIPVVLRNEESLESVGLVVAGIDISEIRVQIEGYRNDILNINKNDITAYIDVTGYKEGLNKIPVEIELPAGFNLTDYSPKQILCDLEAVMNKTIDLTIKIDGRQAAGYYVDSPISSVNSVIVRGPRSVLNSIDKAVALFNINDATETLDKKIPIDIYSDKGLELDLKINPAIAEITVPIYPTASVDIQVPLIGQVKEGYGIKRIKLEPESLIIAAESGVISFLEYLISEPVNVDGKSANIYEALDIIGGNFILTENITPIVTIEIEKIMTQTLSYSWDEIAFENIPEGYEIEKPMEFEDIILTVGGLASDMENLTKEDFIISVDLTGFETLEGEVLLTYTSEKETLEAIIEPENIFIKLIEPIPSEN